MRRRKATLGLALVCALAACALAASGAPAITLHACEETAAGATAQEYTGATCEAKGAGKFRTVPVAEGTLTTPTAVTAQHISATIGGVALEIECVGMSGSGKGENVVIGEARFAFVKALKIKYFECTVVQPKGGGCVLKKAEPPIETTTLRLRTFIEEATIRAEFFVEGTEDLAVFTLEGCKNGALNGEKKLDGEILGFVGADPSLLEFTTTSGSKLTLSGAPANYAGNIRLFMEGSTKRMAFALP